MSKKFQFGQHVEICGYGIETHPLGIKFAGKTLVVDSVRFYQSRYMRPDAYMVYYNVFPVEFEGFEHEEDEWVYEANLRPTSSES